MRRWGGGAVCVCVCVCVCVIQRSPPGKPAVSPPGKPAGEKKESYRRRTMRGCAV